MHYSKTEKYMENGDGYGCIRIELDFGSGYDRRMFDKISLLLDAIYVAYDESENKNEFCNRFDDFLEYVEPFKWKGFASCR